jgi:hypothetical protein
MQPSQAAASVFKSWQASKAGHHLGNVITKRNLSTTMSVETDMKLDDLHMFFSLGCKPLLVRSRSVEGGILTPRVLEKELFTRDCNNRCWSLAMTLNVEGEAFLN